MRYLAILLLAPWLLILCWIYWAYPKNLPRSRSRRLFDVMALIVTALATVESAVIGYDNVSLPEADALGRASGGIWQQVLPALYGYGAFAAALILAFWLRHLLWGRRG